MIIRLEQEKDYREVENLTREAFWNVYCPGCKEHYVLNQYRGNPDFIPELDFVMEEDGKIIGHVMYSKAEIVKTDGSIFPAWTFGPISIHPDYKRKGYGLKLLQYSIEKARELGIGVLCMEGNIDFYKHAGFVVASSLNIHYHGEPEDAEVPYFLAQEIIPGYLNGIEGTYHTPKGYFVCDENPEAFAAYEATFPVKEKHLQQGQLPQFCQSCGMQLSSDGDCGHEKDGSICFDYCQYCYQDGQFLKECTMEEMIDHCAQFVDEVNKNMPEPMTRDQYKDMMRGFFPMLKRWKNVLIATALVFTLTISCDKKADSTNAEYEKIADTISIQSLSDEMALVRDYVPLHANIAHRGTTYWAPEETEASWRWARHMGTDYLEADLQCSKDAVVLAVHDNVFSRTTDIDEVFGNVFPSAVRRVFYKSFKNQDGTQHFTNADIEEQVRADSLLGVGKNARDYYYAEILMLDAGKWFNAANPDRARDAFASDSKALQNTLKAGAPGIVYSNGQYVSALSDMVAFASGQILSRDAEGRRILSYRIKPGFERMSLKQIRERSADQRGTTLAGKHYEADSRYMDFVEYDFANAYIKDNVACADKPGIYIEFKQSTLQPLDIEARTFNLLDSMGWNIITKPSGDKDFFKNGAINVGNTNGKVILQTFRLEAVERVEKVFEGKVPMCYLVDDEPPTDWNPDNYFDDPYNAAKVIEYAIAHKCHIIGPSVDGEPNNYPNRCHSWQEKLIKRAGMLNHPWSIDTPSQMKTTMDAMFTNRTEMTLQWLIDKGLRPEQTSVQPAAEVLDRLGY